MKKVKSHMPTEEELLELNPDNIEIDMDLGVGDEVQDTFNEDDVMVTYDEEGNSSMEGVENAKL